MAGFAGHAVLPSVHHDMEEPKEYNKMVNTTYVIVTAVYALMASAGYAMFGSATMEEVRGGPFALFKVVVVNVPSASLTRVSPHFFFL